MSPVGLALDSSGDMYIGDYGSDRVRKITKSNGYITTVDGWGPNGGTITYYSNPVGISNDPGTGLALYQPYAILADPSSTKVYFAGLGEDASYVLNSATGDVSDFAGTE